MKKIQLNTSRLQLSKEKIASLSKQDLQKIRGGSTDSAYDCNYTDDGRCDPDESAHCSDPQWDPICDSFGECETLNCTPMCQTSPLICPETSYTC